MIEYDYYTDEFDVYINWRWRASFYYYRDAEWFLDQYYYPLF